MQAEGHVALARLFGPGAAEYNLPLDDADSDLQPERQRHRITYDELYDARWASLTAAEGMEADVARDARLRRRWPDDPAGSRQSVSDFLAEVQQQRESRRRDGKARRTGRRQAAAGQRGAAAPDAAMQARQARRMETEAAMLRRRATAAPEEAAVSPAAATDSVEEQTSPVSMLMQVPQGTVRITAGRKRPAPSADPVPAAPVPLDAGRDAHHDASEPDAVSDSSENNSSASDERSGSPGGIGDGSDADSASAFEFVSSIGAGGLGPVKLQDGGPASARLQQSGAQQRPTTAAPPVLPQAWGPCAAGPARAAAEPQVHADPASDNDPGVPPSMRKLRQSALRRSRELLAVRQDGLEPAAAAAGRDDADAAPAAPDTATRSDAVGVHAEQHPDPAMLGFKPAKTVLFWLYPGSCSVGMPPSAVEAGAQEHPDMSGLDSEQRKAANLAGLGTDFAAQLLGSSVRRQAEGNGAGSEFSLLPSCADLPEDVRFVFQSAAELGTKEGAVEGALERYKAVISSPL